MSPPTFSQRLATRTRLWWTRPSSPPALVHWLADGHRFRSRDDPEEAWRCCEAWPRKVVQKWNGREFAGRHGVPVPELYWRGGPLDAAPLGDLPEDFVVRPVRGSWQKGVLVVVGGRDLLSGETVGRAELARRLARRRRLTLPVLVEEFVGAEDGSRRLPLEVKCHVFGGTVGSVEIVERPGGGATSRKRHYRPSPWEPFPDPMTTFLPDGDVRAAPACLDALLGYATRLGEALGTYMRVDFFAAGPDCVFNEFSSVPISGQHYTRYCDELFGALWAENVPDRS